MATVLVLCGIVGHLIGFAAPPTRDVCDVMYPAPRRKPIRRQQSNRVAAQRPSRANRRG